MIEVLSVKDLKDATPDELKDFRRKGLLPEIGSGQSAEKHLDPYGRTRALVMATGNKWAIENFNAAHN